MAGTNLFTSISDTCWVALTEENISSVNGQLAMLAKCTGVPPTTANVFEHGCLIIRTDSGTGVAAMYQNTGSSAVPAWTLLDTSLPGDSASYLIDTNSVIAVSVGTTASAVNGLVITDSATGAVSANAVTVIPGAPSGSDAAISLQVAPKGATGIMTLGQAAGTGDIVVGSSSATQAVKIGNGAGASTVNLANATVAGANINVATAATGAGITDTVAIATGNAAATGIKVVNIATGTPGTAGNNRVTLGGTVADSRVTVKADFVNLRSPNYIATETGANNAIVGALTDAGGTNVPLVAGLRVAVKLAHTLQAGANTFDFNGGGAVAIKMSTNAASDLGTAYAATGIIELMWDGTAWLCMSQ